MPAPQWDLLTNHESFELIKRDYSIRHGRTPNNRHALEIAAPFTHARSYFRAAQAAESTVKPLLLYYGVVSLSRGLTLMLSRGLREAALAPSHGLSVKDWGSELCKDNPDFAALRVEVNAAGSFLELAQATGFKSLLRSNSSTVNYPYTHPSVGAGAMFSLGDVVSRLPALQDHCSRWRDAICCAPFKFEKINDQEVHVRLQKPQWPWATSLAPDTWLSGTAFRFEAETPEQVVFTGPDDTEKGPGITDHVDQTIFGIGDLWMTAPYPGGPTISKISTLFLLSYMLGMLVRYYPMQWTALIRSQIADAALPTLAAAVEVIEQEFPRLVLDFLAVPPSAP